MGEALRLVGVGLDGVRFFLQLMLWTGHCPHTDGFATHVVQVGRTNFHAPWGIIFGLNGLGCVDRMVVFACVTYCLGELLFTRFCVKA